MQTNVAVIGNSHVGAIKLGWDLISADHPDIVMDFMGSPAQTLADTYMDGKTLKSDDPSVRESLLRSRGSHMVDFAAFDHVWIIGGGVNVRSFARIFTAARIHPHGESAVAGGGPARRQRALGDLDLVSPPLVVEAYRQRLSQTAARHLIDMFRAHLDVGLQLVHEPHLSEQAMEDDDRAHLKWIHENGLGGLVADIFDTTCQEEFGSDAVFVLQPKDTVVNFVYTDRKYAAGGATLKTMSGGASKQRLGDRAHKNADYGRRIVEIMLANAGLSGVAAAQPAASEAS